MKERLKKYLESPKALFSPDPSILTSNKTRRTSWNKNELAKLIKRAHKNIFATYCNYGLMFNKFNDIYSLYKEISKALKVNNSNILQVLFFSRMCSAFTCGVTLSSSGYVPETYLALRSCLEYSLYAFYISENISKAQIWINRHDDENSKKKCKKEFAIGSLLTKLEQKDNDIGQKTRTLYEKSIDYGAHPNEKGVMQSTVLDPDSLKSMILESGDSNAMKFSLLQTARIGICCFDIFQFVFPVIYNDLNIHKKLKRLKTNL